MRILPILAASVLTAHVFAQDSQHPVSNGDGQKQKLSGTSRSYEFIPGQSIQVAVPYSSRAALVTCVSFPEKSIRSIVAAWTESNVSLEHTGGNLFIKLLQEREGHIDVVGGSGRVYRLYVKPVTAGVYDESLQVTLTDGADSKKKNKPSSQFRSLALDLMLAMRRGEQFDGALITAGPDHAVQATAHAEMFIRLVFELDGFVGYTVELKNRSESETSLDLSRFQGEGLLLIGAREMSVKPGASTLIYLVFSEAQ